MPDYSEFLIADLKTGLMIGKDPWITPYDGFPVLLDAYIDKGVLKRVSGNSDFIATGLGGKPVVGMFSIPYSGYNEVVICTTKRAFGLSQDAVITSLVADNTFTGGEDDYFWFQEYGGKLYFCNGIDAIYKHTPNYGPQYTMPAMNTGAVTIQTCKMLFTYKNRLIIVSPKIGGVWYPNYIYYTDVNLDNVGATNFVKAQSEDTPVTGGYIGDVPVIFCRNGAVYHIAYTGDTDAPFTWDKRSIDVGAQARMGTSSFKDLLATVGLNRLLTYDRYQAQDYDMPVRGILDEMSATKVVNSYAHRMLDRNFLYILYTRTGQTDHDRVLVYNIDEGSFSQQILTANCLFSINGPWQTEPLQHGTYAYPITDSTYKKYEFAGTKTGKILQLNTGGAIATDIRSAQLNPYSKEGRQAKMGWVKLLINGPYGSSLTVSLYKNYSETAFKTAIVDSRDSVNHWQTVYADGEVGDFFRLKIVHTYHPDNSGAIDIHAFLFGFKPAGRLGERTEWVAPGQVQ